MGIIEVSGLVKVYRNGSRALDGVSFDVAPGEVFGFLGPNGAGKSTTMKILTTLVRPTSGRVHVADLDVTAAAGEVRRRIGYAAQEIGLDREATGRENLLLQGQLYHVPGRTLRLRVEQLLGFFDLAETAGRLVSAYSGGMRKRLDLAAALVHRPAVLLLDEPTVGLDPPGRAHVWEYVKRLRDEGMTILLSTHYLEEADRLADRIAIIDHGRIVAIGTPDALKDEVRGDRVAFRVMPDALEQARQILARQATGLAQAEGDTVWITVEHGAAVLPLLLRALDAAGVAVLTAEIARPSLDEVFLRKTGRLLQGKEAGGA